jgi:anaerobic magnesium-protoporphyrin IX monomethyl ester cyclase
MSQLDVVFVIPSVRTDGAYGPVAKDAIEPPAKARFMAAYLMRRNVSVELIDANITDDTPEQMAVKVEDLNPHLVVMPVYGFNPSSSTQTMPSARAYAQAIKNIIPRTPILMTGTHPAALPVKTLQEEPINFVCGGEGPITVHELLQVLQAGNYGIGIENVRSLWRWEDGRIIHNPAAPLIDINVELAIDGWKLMDPRKYRAHHWHTFYRDFEDRGPYANPFSWEGCPFHCEFCNIQAPFREGELLQIESGGRKSGTNSYRSVLPENFVAEVTHLVEQYGVKYFKIPDEMFALNQAHVLALAKGISERFGDSLNFWAYARVDTCKSQMLEPLRAAGFRWLALGIEAANSDVRSGQDKSFGEEHIYRVVHAIDDAGIEGGLNYIFGLPGDTMESMQATYAMAAALNGPYANFYCTQALPGAELYRQAKVNGYPLPERLGGPGWIGHSQYGYDCEPYYDRNGRDDALTPAEILRFTDERRIEYYCRPEYIDMLRSKSHFGQTAVRNILDWVDKLSTMRRRLLEEVPMGVH